MKKRARPPSKRCGQPPTYRGRKALLSAASCAPGGAGEGGGLPSRGSGASKHFRIVANLATAWQLEGDLDQSAACLREAIRLAPGKLQHGEELQLRLVEGRRLQKKAEGLDDLFGVRFVGEGGKFEPGRLAADERKKLPADALAQAQLLGLWLPADGKLLWLLAEMANVQGDIQTAAAFLTAASGNLT